MADPSSDPRFYQLRDAAYADRPLAERMILADPSVLSARSSIGETALHTLVIENAREAVEFLVSRGAVVDTENEFGDTPLVDAAALGYLELCQFLVQQGADLRHVSRLNGNSACSRAARADQPDVLIYLLGLLQPEEDLNPLFSDTDAELALDGRERVARLLVARGLKRRWLQA